VGGTKSLKRSPASWPPRIVPSRKLSGKGDSGRLVLSLERHPLTLPPLRERSGDVRLLGEAFLRTLAERPVERSALSASAWERLEGYPWPGNVRELEHCLHRAVILSSGDLLDVDAFPSLAAKASTEPLGEGGTLREVSLLARARRKKGSSRGRSKKRRATRARRRDASRSAIRPF
jgi:transcriptional regulator with GAF, ATPase, and Fis domain